MYYGIVKRWAREGHGVSAELYLVCETREEAEDVYYRLQTGIPTNIVRYTIEPLRVLDEYDD